MSGAPGSALRVVAIDDDEQHLKFIAKVLSRENVSVYTSTSPQEGLQQVYKERPNLVVVDLVMPGMSGLQTLERIVEFDPAIEVVLLTGQYSTDSAVEAIQKGAADYLTKPVDVEKLEKRVEALLLELHKGQRCLQLEHELLENSQFSSMVGHSAAMLEVFHRIRRVAPHFRTVLLTGETGVGKELAAQALHWLSPACSGPFVTCNCSAVVETLAESELFGHVKGAFTSAVASKKGLFEIADRGTLFLDEIGTMGLETQSKILRVLQDRKFMHLGGVHELQVDVRIIAATNVDLRQMVREGKFREDLFYRLNVITIDLPPLRQRREDIPLLVDFFLKKYSVENERPVRRLTTDCLRPLMGYSWPGNVRELENVIERAVVLSLGAEIGPDLLPDHIAGRGTKLPVLEHRPDASLFDIMEDCERRIIVDMLEKCGWNQTDASERFRVPLSTLNQKIKRLNIEIKKKSRE
jgi:DNA-binding NtrC family response regulator